MYSPELESGGLFRLFAPAVRSPRLKSLIVELQVFAWYIFSLCAMFSLPLRMGWVYCDSVSDHTPVSGSAGTFICSILCLLEQLFFFLPAPPAPAVDGRWCKTSGCYWNTFLPDHFQSIQRKNCWTNEPSRNQLTVVVKGNLCTVVWSIWWMTDPFTQFSVETPLKVAQLLIFW